MKHTVPLIALSVLAACAPADDDELALDDAPAHVHAAAAQPVTETALRTMAMAEAPNLDKPVIHVWKSPTCGCCAMWVEHLKGAGYPVEVEEIADINAIKREKGIPARAWSCHTAEVAGYLIEGHVPATTIDKALAEEPEVAGLSVPGMPMGSPGMEVPGMEPQPYQVVSFTKEGRVELYEQH